MDIGEIVSDAIKYPSFEWKKVIILGILMLISFLIVPAFLVMGYVFRALKASIAGATELPEFDEWGEMFIDGLKVFVAQFIYFLIPAIVIFIGVWASLGTMNMMGPDAVLTGMSVGVITGGALIGMLLAIIFGLVAIIAVANMAYYDSDLGAAFNFSEILDHISDIGWVDYIIWYIVMIVIGAIGGFIAGILNIIPFIGTIIALLVVYPYLYLFYARSLALLFVSRD